MQQKKFKKIGILLSLFQNFSLAIERTSVRCWFDNLGRILSLNDFIVHTSSYIFCDPTIPTKLRLLLCISIPTDIHTNTSEASVVVRKLHHDLVSVYHVLKRLRSLTSRFVGTFDNFSWR